jgi:hypothetical protein
MTKRGRRDVLTAAKTLEKLSGAAIVPVRTRR